MQKNFISLIKGLDIENRQKLAKMLGYKHFSSFSNFLGKPERATNDKMEIIQKFLSSVYGRDFDMNFLVECTRLYEAA